MLDLRPPSPAHPKGALESLGFSPNVSPRDWKRGVTPGMLTIKEHIDAKSEVPYRNFHTILPHKFTRLIIVPVNVPDYALSHFTTHRIDFRRIAKANNAACCEYLFQDYPKSAIPIYRFSI